jgi:PAS domain S-box-containing protein
LAKFDSHWTTVFGRIWNGLLNRVLPPSLDRESLAYSREIILLATLLIGAVFGGLVSLPSILVDIHEKRWGLAAVTGALYLSVLALFYLRRWPYVFRTVATMLVMYAFGLSIFLTLGPASSAPAWLFAFAVLSGILLGIKGATGALILNALTFLALSLFFNLPFFGQSQPFYGSLARALVVGVNFLLLNTFAAVAIAVLVGKLEKTVSGLRIASDNLAREQINLQEEIKISTEARQALAESEEKYRLLVENQSDLIIRTDTEGRLLFVSPSYCRMFGQTEAELVGHSFMPLVHEDDREAAAQILMDIRLPPHEAYLEQRVWTPSGLRWLAWAIKAQLDPQGQVVSTMAVGRDSTDRQEAELALRASEARLRAIFQAADQVAFIITDVRDPEPLVLEFSPGAEKMFGYTQEEMVGRSVAILHVPEDRAKYPDIHQYLREKNEGFKSEFTFVRKSGEKFPAMFAASPLLDKDGRLLAALGVAMDLSEQRTLESQLLQAQKMEAIGTLASGVAHDFNNILQAIVGNIHLLKDWPGLPDKAGRRLTEIDQATQRASDLIQHLLTFSRKMDPELKPLDLKKEILQVMKILDHTIPKMIGIEIDLADDLWAVKADGGQVQQILLNLAANARDAMPGGGSLGLTAENTRIDHDDFNGAAEIRPGPYVRISVKDTGHGIAPEDIDQVFDPFFTKKEIGRGTGLGLSIVYGLVKAHGGHIYCQSTLGLGTTFTFFLPALDRVLVPELQSEIIPGRETLTGHETIMLVDDETAILEVVGEVLQNHGYRVLRAGGGEEALDIYRAGPETIDLIILDLGMPGMGGLGCLKEILALNQRQKVIVASGYSPLELTPRVMEIGARGFVGKPYRFSDMTKVIREVLDED